MERTTGAKDGMIPSPELRGTDMVDLNQRRGESTLAQRHHPESVDCDNSSHEDLGLRVLASINQMIDDAQYRSKASFPLHTHAVSIAATQAVGQTKNAMYVSSVRHTWKHRLSA